MSNINTLNKKTFNQLVSDGIIAGASDKSPESIKEIFAEYFSLYGDSGDSYNKLNLVKCDYGYRVRYEKNSDGDITTKIMDRGFIGLQASRVGLDGDSVVNCFIYGKRTVGFVIMGAKVIANKNLDQSSDFCVLLYNFMKNQSIDDIEWTDSLPTGERPVRAVKTLDDELKNIKSVDEISADLGF